MASAASSRPRGAGRGQARRLPGPRRGERRGAQGGGERKRPEPRGLPRPPSPPSPPAGAPGRTPSPGQLRPRRPRSRRPRGGRTGPGSGTTPRPSARTRSARRDGPLAAGGRAGRRRAAQRGDASTSWADSTSVPGFAGTRVTLHPGPVGEGPAGRGDAKECPLFRQLFRRSLLPSLRGRPHQPRAPLPPRSRSSVSASQRRAGDRREGGFPHPVVLRREPGPALPAPEGTGSRGLGTPEANLPAAVAQTNGTFFPFPPGGRFCRPTYFPTYFPTQDGTQ